MWLYEELNVSNNLDVRIAYHVLAHVVTYINLVHFAVSILYFTVYLLEYAIEVRLHAPRLFRWIICERNTSLR